MMITNKIKFVFNKYAEKAFILFFALLMLAGFGIISESEAAITQPSAWASQYAAIAFPSGTINSGYTIAAGSNRVLIIAISSSITVSAAQSITTVSYGGQNLTLAAGDAGTSIWNHSYLYYLNEAGIAAATNTNLNVTVTGGTAYYNRVYAAVFAGADLSSPVNDAKNYNSTTADTAVGPFSPTLTINPNGQAVEIVNLARSTDGTTLRNINTWATGWTTAGIDVTYNTASSTTPTQHLYIRNRAIPGVLTNDGSQHTANSANTWDSMTALSLREPSYGTLQFTSATYSESEAVGTTATITISRTGGSTGIVTADCNTVAGGTATAGNDYTTVTAQTLTWANGDTANKTCAIPIINDILYEGNETVNLTLNNATGGATIGAQNTSVLTIVDNDPIPPPGTPVALHHTYAGNYDFVGTGGTLRTNPNSIDACSLLAPGVNSSGMVSGIPAGATIIDARLYWAGSGATPDYTITFEGQSLGADDQYTEMYNYGGGDKYFFSGEKDVTSIVAGKSGGSNGTYTFTNLLVDSSATYCGVANVLSGWGLIIIYEDLITPAPLRVINIYDGFQHFFGSQISLTPSNFVVPGSNYDGKHGHLSWEGDETNSGPLNGISENLTFKGNPLSNSLNVTGNQFNSTVTHTPDPPCTNCTNASYGVDFDTYNVTSYLSGGETSVNTLYSTGGDLVILSAEIISVTNTPTSDLQITKSHTGDFIVNQVNSFSIVVKNNGPSNETNTITVTDTLPSGLTLDSWSGTNWAHPTATTWTYVNTLSSGATAPILTLNVLVGSSAYPGVNNTAYVSSPTFDWNSSNDSSTDSVTVKRPSLITSTKTVVDLNGGFADPGDTIRYTINIKENGGVDATNVSVTDNMPANVTGFTVIGIPSGATNSSSPAPAGSNNTGYLNVTGFTVPANGAVTVIFDVTIAGGTPGGTLINNTATVNNPNGPGATPVAPTVVVSQTIPGNKQLYFQAPDSENTPTQPQSMNRVPLSSAPTPVRVRIQREDTPRFWAQTPVLQSPLTITSNMSVTLQLRRDTTTNDRSVKVTVDYLPGPVTIGTSTLTLSGATLSSTVTKAFTFPITIIPATPLTLPTGAQLRVTVDNEPTAGPTGWPIYVYPYDSVTGDNTRLEMDVTTVIDVNSVNFYNAAYPGGSLLTKVVPNTTVYIRSVVSDPFGSFDITGAKIDIINPNLSTIVAGAAMTQVADSGAATKTYEYQYTYPSAGPVGFWTANVTSTEGTEGTIIDTNFGLLKVVLPDIIMLKTSITEWDPVNLYGGDGTEPKSIPGADIIYTIQSTNTGEGAADNNSVIITDPIPENTKLFVDNYGGTNGCGPIEFIDGSPTSGLTCAFTSLGSNTDDIDFSSTAPPGPYVYNYTPVSAGGYDPLVTSIRISPKGIFNGTGGGNPYFSIKLRARVN